MYELILFDFDFTLVDSSNGIIDCIKYALEKLGYDLPLDEDIKKTIGIPLRDAFEIFTNIKSEMKYNLFKHYFMERSLDVMCDKTVIFEDTVDTLKRIKESNRKVAIVSAKDKKTICKIAEKYGFADYIDIVIGEHEVINQKPHPEQVYMAQNILNISSEKVLYIGDSLIDGYAAQNANVDFIAVTTGTAQSQHFKDIPCKSIVSDLKEILCFI